MSFDAHTTIGARKLNWESFQLLPSPNDVPNLLSHLIKLEDTPESDFTPTPPWSAIPKTIQVIANKAAKGSLQDLEVLVMYMEIDKHLARQAQLLPMLYGHLDKKPPTPYEDVASIRAVKLAEAALVGVRETFRWLNNSRFPLDDTSLTFQYFGRSWPSIWRWMDYLYTRTYPKGLFQPHEHRLTKSEHKTIQTMEGIFSIIISCPETVACKAIDSTPGAFLMFSDMWVRLSEKPSGDADTRTLLSFGLIDCIVRSPERAMLLVDVLGGDFTKIAPVFLENIRIAIEKGGKWELSLPPLMFVMVTLTHILPKLGHAFLAQHIVIEVSRVLAHYSTTPVASVTTRAGSLACLCCRASLTYLSIAFTITDGFTWVSQAIRSKFIPSVLRTVIMCTQALKLKYDPRLAASFEEVVHLANDAIRKFSAFLLFRSVLKALERVWQDPQITALEAQIPQDGEFWRSWTEFKRSAGFRREIKIKFEKFGKYSQYCGGPGCKNVETTNPFSICAACQKSVYCSKTCQQKDWKSGAHREYCKQLSRDRAAGIGCPISSRDFAFLHFNAIQDIAKHRDKIIKARNKVLSRKNSLEYAIFLDYTVTPIFIGVDTPESFSPDDANFGAAYPDPLLESITQQPNAVRDGEYPVVFLTIRVIHGETQESCAWRSDQSGSLGDDAWHKWALGGIMKAHANNWKGVPIASDSEFDKGTVGLASRMIVRDRSLSGRGPAKIRPPNVVDYAAPE